MCARMYVDICMHQHVCMFIHSPYMYTSLIIMRVDTCVQNACSYVCMYVDICMHQHVCICKRFPHTFTYEYIMRMDTNYFELCALMYVDI